MDHSKKKTSEAVFESIRRDILNGAIPAGSILPSESALSNRFGVHRGIIREAVKQLKQIALIQTQRNGKCLVHDFQQKAGLEILGPMLIDSRGQINVEVARSISELRTDIACQAARRAAERRTELECHQLDKIYRQMAKQIDDLAALQNLALEFWETIIIASKNIAYRLAFNSLDQAYSGNHDLLRPIMASEIQTLDLYEGIAVAVEAQNPELATNFAMELTSIGASAIDNALNIYQRLVVKPKKKKESNKSDLSQYDYSFNFKK